MSIKYDKTSDKWYNPEYIPDNPRNILLYSEDTRVTEGFYDTKHNRWHCFKWDCDVIPLKWRELPYYDSNGNI